MFARLLVSAAFTGLVALSIATPVLAQPAPRKDFQILQGVTREVQRYVNYTVFDDISVGVENGVVTLTGKVTMPYKRDDIEKRVVRTFRCPKRDQSDHGVAGFAVRRPVAVSDCARDLLPTRTSGRMHQW